MQVLSHHTGNSIFLDLEEFSEEGVALNKKIKRYLDEIQKTEAKIAELQVYLKGVRTALKQEENNEIIKSFRGMKLGSQELIEVLSGIQDGTLTIQTIDDPESMKEDGSFTFSNQSRSEDLEEREDKENDESKDIQ